MLVATRHASFRKAALVKLTIKLTAQGKRMFKTAKRLHLTAEGTYTPMHRAPVVATKVITLKR